MLADLDGQIDLVIDSGPTTLGLESTVLDLTGELRECFALARSRGPSSNRHSEGRRVVDQAPGENRPRR